MGRTRAPAPTSSAVARNLLSVPGPASPGAGAGGPGLLSGRGRGGEHEAELLAAGGCAASWAWLPGPVAGAFDDERLRAGLAESSRRLCARGAQNSPRRARCEAPLKFPSRHKKKTIVTIVENSPKSVLSRGARVHLRRRAFNFFILPRESQFPSMQHIVFKFGNILLLQTC